MYGVTTRRPSSSQETRLPHGECRFILLHPEISGQRCSCQGFWLNKAVLGSSCECGHQACYHEPTQPQEALNRDQYDVLLSRVAHLEKQLSRTGASREEGTTSEGGDIKVVEEQLDREKSDREDDVRRVYRTFQGIYEQLSMSQKATFHRMLEQDDKIEGMVDKVTECSEELQTIRERFAQVDEVSMALEDRLDEMSEALERAESTIPHTKRSISTQTSPPPPRLLARPASSLPTVSVEVTIMLSASQTRPFSATSRGGQRGQSRGLTRRVVWVNKDGQSFRRAIEASFSTLLAGRAWMPLGVSRGASVGEAPWLHTLTSDQLGSDLWGMTFLQDHCLLAPIMGHDKPRMYIALREGSLSWEEIRRQPRVGEAGRERERDAELACWAYDDGLDGRAPSPPKTKMDPIVEGRLTDPPSPPPLSLPPSLPSLSRSMEVSSRLIMAPQQPTSGISSASGSVIITRPTVTSPIKTSSGLKRTLSNAAITSSSYSSYSSSSSTSSAASSISTGYTPGDLSPPAPAPPPPPSSTIAPSASAAFQANKRLKIRAALPEISSSSTQSHATGSATRIDAAGVGGGGGSSGTSGGNSGGGSHGRVGGGGDSAARMLGTSTSFVPREVV